MLKSGKFRLSNVVKAINDVFNQRTKDVLMTVVNMVENKETRYYQENFAWNYPKEQRTSEMYTFMLQTHAQRVFLTHTTRKEKEEYLTDIIVTAAMFLADLRASNDQNPTAEEEQEKTPNPWFNTAIRDQMG